MKKSEIMKPRLPLNLQQSSFLAAHVLGLQMGAPQL